ncbi:TPA: hypothetical protein OUZ96_000098 [Legionella pneumophila]|nr:hypothetical protein [Legionella pneumophila]
MLAIFIFMVLTNSYVVLRLSPTQYLKLHRFRGQLLYIKAIAVGSFIVFLAYTIERFLPSISEGIENENTIFELFIISLIISFGYVFLCHISLIYKGFKCECGQIKGLLIKWHGNGKNMVVKQLLQDSPIDVILLSSLENEKFLLISMSDRKAYVGRVVSMGEPNELDGPDQEIAIVPVMSGYRDKDTMELQLTTVYEKVNDKDPVIVLRQENIVSVCEYIESLYTASHKSH